MYICKVLLILGLLCTATGCSPTKTDEENKGIGGFVVETRPDTLQFLVTESDETKSSEQYDAVFYTVVPDTTIIIDRKGNTLQFSDISIGQEVDVWANTPEAQSYPASAQASKILIREDPNIPASKVTRSQAIRQALREFEQKQPKGKIVKKVVFERNAWIISVMDYKGDVQAQISIDASTGQVLAD